MYIYEGKPIEDLSGMTMIKDYIKLCNSNHGKKDNHYLSFFQLQKFLVNSFLNVLTVTKCLTIRKVDNIAISSLPHQCSHNKKILYFDHKESNLSYIVSEYGPLDIGFRLLKCSSKDTFNIEYIINAFQNSYQITISLIEDSINESIDEPKIIKLKDVSNAIKEAIDTKLNLETDKNSDYEEL